MKMNKTLLVVLSNGKYSYRDCYFDRLVVNYGVGLRQRAPGDIMWKLNGEKVL